MQLSNLLHEFEFSCNKSRSKNMQLKILADEKYWMQNYLRGNTKYRPHFHKVDEVERILI